MAAVIQVRTDAVVSRRMSAQVELNACLLALWRRINDWALLSVLFSCLFSCTKNENFSAVVYEN